MRCSEVGNISSRIINIRWRYRPARVNSRHELLLIFGTSNGDKHLMLILMVVVVKVLELELIDLF